jgi:oxygen-independent coproporphyrinogen-3 oxidase
MQNARTPLSAENADEVENLTPADEMAEFLFLGLRKTRGISARDFAENFGRDIGEVYEKPLRKLENGGWLKREGDRVFLTERGIDVSNMVFVEFLEPEV